MPEPRAEAPASEVAARFCGARSGWVLGKQLGAGGTAPVLEVNTPDGSLALKINDTECSSGERGEIEEKRIEKQVALKGHTCK